MNEVRRQAKYCEYPECTNNNIDKKELLQCSRCQVVYYCGTEHQKLHWKEHKKICKQY